MVLELSNTQAKIKHQKSLENTDYFGAFLCAKICSIQFIFVPLQTVKLMFCVLIH